MLKKIASMLAIGIIAANAHAQMTGDIIDVAAGSPDHTTLVTAVKAAGLAEILEGQGPFTIFAPTNAAFAKLHAGTVDNLVKPENQKQLSDILFYHVVAGKLDARQVLAAIAKGNGKASLTTVQGGALIASLENGKVILSDENGRKATVTTTDLIASNGIIHVIDAVLTPKSKM
jgi:uncharacterized surface protein with fasciclin (FAS1) repeats